MRLNRILAVLGAALFLISALSYRESVVRAERFERGQRFLQSLNADDIAEIMISKGEESTHLRRAEGHFEVVGAHGYPAKNDAVNRFVRDVLELGLEKEVGSGESLREELGIEPRTDSSIEVSFNDGAGQEMVKFVVGNPFDGGSGNYIQRLDQEDAPIYLSSTRVHFSTTEDDFLDKQILDVAKEQIVGITGNDFQINSEDGELALVNLPAGQKESAKFNHLGSLLAGLRFSKHYLANDSAVQNLRFQPALTYELGDDSGYQIALASEGEKYFITIQGFHNAGRIEIAMDAEEGEVRETSEILARGDEIQEFNSFHGSWVYEVTEFTAEKLRYRGSDLREEA